MAHCECQKLSRLVDFCVTKQRFSGFLLCPFYIHCMWWGHVNPQMGLVFGVTSVFGMAEHLRLCTDWLQQVLANWMINNQNVVKFWPLYILECVKWGFSNFVIRVFAEGCITLWFRSLKIYRGHIQDCHFSRISGNLEMSANSAQVTEKSGERHKVREMSGEFVSSGLSDCDTLAICW